MSVEAQTFDDAVDRWVHNAVTNGVTTFNSLVASLPGVYPSVVYQSLKRLTASGKFAGQVLPLTSGLVGSHEHTAERSSNHRHSIILPVPHPLDYDWRFGDSAVKYLLDKCLTFAEEDETIILLGTPSIFRLALETSYPRNMILLDSNPAVVNQLNKQVPTAHVVQCNIVKDTLPQMEASVVIVDPPWYEEQMLGFIWAAANICRVGGYVLASVPPIGTRHGINCDREKLFEWSNRLGLKLIMSEAAILPYLSPPFEINALKAEGLCSILGDWRRGDLVVFIKENSAILPQPVVSSHAENYWIEESLHEVRIRVKPSCYSGFDDPTLTTIVPGDVLPSVSRRDSRRKLVDVWTSGNRVFACQGRNVMAHILRAFVLGESSVELVAKAVGRELSVSERTLVANAANQISEIVNTERNEIALRGEVT